MDARYTVTGSAVYIHVEGVHAEYSRRKSWEEKKECLKSAGSDDFDIRL